MPKPVIFAETTHALSVQISAADSTLSEATPAEDSLLKNHALVQYQNLFRHGNPNYKSPKHYTDDAANIIWIDGLPTVVIADGGFGSNNEPPQILCNVFLPKILPRYVERLANGEQYELVLFDLLKAVNRKAHAFQQEYQWNEGAAFTFSCAIAYSRRTDQSAFLVTVGVGTDLMAVYRSNQYLSLKPALSKVLLPVPEQELKSHAFISSGSWSEWDAIVALSDGAYSHLPLVEADDGGLVLPTDFEVRPYKLLESNRDAINREVLQTNEKTGDDALLAMAIVPQWMKQNEIRYAAMDDVKSELISILRREYPWRPRLFGRHHNERRVAVCHAIRVAGDMNEIHNILNNQQMLVNGVSTDMGSYINPNILAQRWTTDNQIHNRFSDKSLYKTVINQVHNRLEQLQSDDMDIRAVQLS